MAVKEASSASDARAGPSSCDLLHASRAWCGFYTTFLFAYRVAFISFSVIQMICYLVGRGCCLWQAYCWAKSKQWRISRFSGEY